MKVIFKRKCYFFVGFALHNLRVFDQYFGMEAGKQKLTVVSFSASKQNEKMFKHEFLWLLLDK